MASTVPVSGGDEKVAAAAVKPGRYLHGLQFDNSVLRRLPIDQEKENYVRSPVSGACFSLVEPTPVDSPVLVCVSPGALALLGASVPPMEQLSDDAKRYLADHLSGNKVIPGCRPAAHCYCGHQFGHFSGQLGDGATMYLGEVVSAQGRWELQFKGAGKTPYSRSADGRKVLRSSIREFLCSEHMHGLGIPTTRAGSIVTSDTKVWRDLLYNGNAIQERATIITRIAPSFLRFGSFEIFRQESNTGRVGPSPHRTDILLTMLDFTIESYYPDIFKRFHGKDSDDSKGAVDSAKSQAASSTDADSLDTPMYTEFFKEVVLRTARLVAQWQAVGWCHGVLNTDNMSILGLTIDYGPFGFMEHYDPNFICNGSDNTGRYSYANQPEMCKWNVKMLGEAIQDVLPLDVSAKIVEDLFDKEVDRVYYQTMMNKLGLPCRADDEHADLQADRALVAELLSTLEHTSADYTNVFRALASVSAVPDPTVDDAKAMSADPLAELFATEMCRTVEQLKAANKPMVPAQTLAMITMMTQGDPAKLARMGVPPELYERAVATSRKYEELSALEPSAKLENDRRAWTQWLGSYRARLAQLGVFKSQATLDAHRKRLNAVNPKFVLRNSVAQQAIDRAEKDDFSLVNTLLKVLLQPFDEHSELSGDLSAVLTAAPKTAEKLCVT